MGAIDTPNRGLKPNKKYPVTLLQADFCPFANRASIALLEKEKDPYNPVHFENVHVCFQLGPEKDPGTEWLYSLGFKTVPVLIDNTNDGKAMSESMHVVEKVDGMFPNNPLQPSDPETKAHMKRMIGKRDGLVPAVYKLMTNQSSEEKIELTKTLLEILASMNDDLKESKGPYFCGDQFTMADIAFFPFIERVKVVLSHYRSFVFPKELSYLNEWYEEILKRPSVKITTADRDDVSLKTYFCVQQKRDKYLIEIYESYANNEIDLGKKIGGELSAPGVNAYAEFKKKQAAEASKKDSKDVHVEKELPRVKKRRRMLVDDRREVQ